MSTITIDVVVHDQAATAAMKNMGDQITKSQKRWSTFGPVAANAISTVGDLALKAGTAVVKFGADSVKAASDLNETVSKSSKIFGKNQKEISSWASNAAKNLGLSKQQAMESAASFGDMFLQLGFAGGKATDMSKKVVQLSADLGSFNNLPTADVSERIAAAFRGEYDSLQALVPTINAAAVEKQALATTGKKSADSLTAEEKAAAVLKITMDKTKRAQGDFAATSDGLANKQKILTARFDDLKAKLGTALLPAVSDVAGAVGEMFDEFEKSGAIDDAAAAIKDFTSNLDPKKMSDTVGEAVRLATAFGDAAAAISDANAAITTDSFGKGKGQKMGGGLTEFLDELVADKAKILRIYDDIATAGAKLGLIPKDYAEKVHGMRVKADADLSEHRAKWNETRRQITIDANALAQKKVVTKLRADKKDAEDKIKDINRQLQKTNDKKTESKLKADKRDAERKIKDIDAALRHIPKTVNTSIVFHSVGFGGVMAKVRAAKGAAMVRIKVPNNAYGGPIGLAPGGFVPGESPNIRADNIPILGTAGEYMMQVPATRFWGGGFMNAVNSNDLTQVRQAVGAGGNNVTYIINAPNYVGDKRDLVKALTDLNRQGRLEVVRR